MKTTLKTATRFSKRDSLIFATALVLTTPLLAKDRSKTEAEAPTDLTCVDCVVGAGTYGNSNFGDLRGMNRDVAIFLTPDGKDPRQVMDRQANPQLNAIGMVAITGESKVASRDPKKIFAAGRHNNLGSGFLINECLVVTNHHVAFQNRRATEFEAKKIEFYAGTSSSSISPGFKSEGKVVAHGNFQYSSDSKNDWAIIKLDQIVFDPKNPNHPRANWYIKPEFKTHRQISRTNLAAASFYQDQEKFKNGTQLWGQVDCRTTRPGLGELVGTWATNCPAIPGVSGTPLTNSPVPGQPIVAYGIMSNVTSDNTFESNESDLNLNHAVPFSEAMSPEQLEEIIRANPCTNNLKA